MAKMLGTAAIRIGLPWPTPKIAAGEIAQSSSMDVPKLSHFLTRKWNKELDYRLIKEMWAFGDNRIAVRFAYEWHDDSANWFRSYGNENWEFDAAGVMLRRFASINDFPIRRQSVITVGRWGDGPTITPAFSELGL